MATALMFIALSAASLGIIFWDIRRANKRADVRFDEDIAKILEDWREKHG